jgi:hypothetical protein
VDKKGREVKFMKYFDSWEDAGRESRFRKAVGRLEVKDQMGRRCEVDVIKPLSGDGKVCYKNSVYPIRRATSQDIDQVKRWWPY